MYVIIHKSCFWCSWSSLKFQKNPFFLFQTDFNKNGQLVQGIAPMDAVDHLSRFREELKI